MNNNMVSWWPLCLSEQLTNKAPLAITFSENKMAAYRDARGQVRVVEDRCPHRRAPLSMGRITDTGDIQCGYHGWTFNGESGDMSGFPNLDEGERLPRCQIKTYSAKESQGLVYVQLNPESDKQIVLIDDVAASSDNALHFSGQSFQALSHYESVAALLDQPNYFLSIFAVEFVEKSLGDPRVEEGMLITERVGRWNLCGESRFFWGPLRHRADFPLRLITKTAPETGETLAYLYSDTNQLMAKLHIALSPTVRAMTTLTWQAEVYPESFAKLSLMMKLLASLRFPLVRFYSKIDAKLLAAELPAMGEHWRSLTKSFLQADAADMQ